MKLVKYILRKIIPFFLISLFFVALILNLVDLFMNITKYMEMKAALASVLKVMVLYIPKTIWYAAPIAFLFSITYILSDLYSSNEMEALFASGISLLRFVFPVFIFAIIGSIGMFFWEDKLVVDTLKQKKILQNELLGTTQSNNNSNVVVQSSNGNLIYKVQKYYDSEKLIENCTFIFRDDDKNLLAIITADSGIWDDEENRWILAGANQYSYQNKEIKLDGLETKYLEQLTDSYEIFKRANLDVESEKLKDAKIYINHLKKAGLPYYEPQSVYFKKFAFPFIFLIAALLAVGVTGRTRKNVLLISLFLSIGSVVLFYVFQMCTMVLAKTQFLTPMMGAWLPDIVFLIISIFLLKYQRN